jgi:hypothetical protein
MTAGREHPTLTPVPLADCLLMQPLTPAEADWTLGRITVVGQLHPHHIAALEEAAGLAAALLAPDSEGLPE